MSAKCSHCKAYLFLDEYASMMSSQEEEYEELEKLLRETVPCESFYFRRNVTPQELAGQSPDIYAFDIGGMCYEDHSGDRRLNWCHNVIRQVEDHPDTLFVPFSEMTSDYWKFAIEEFLPELLNAPNVFAVKMTLDDWEKKGLKDFIRRWFER